MERTLRNVVVTALLAYAAGYILWPPGRVYWTTVADVIGEPVTIAVVLLLAGATGGVSATLSGADPIHIAIGGSVAYTVGMVLVETITTPDSPVHFVLYGTLLVCWVVGAAVTTRYGRADAAPLP